MESVTRNNESLKNDLINSISGYEGYGIQKSRCQSDRRLREFLSEKLLQIEKNLSDFEHHYYQHHKNANLDPFHRISLSLRMLIQSIKEPSSNESQFFSQSKVEQGKVSQLYEYDIQLKNQVDILAEEAKELNDINGEFEVEDMLNHLYDLIDGANQTLSEREFLMMSE